MSSTDPMRSLLEGAGEQLPLLDLDGVDLGGDSFCADEESAGVGTYSGDVLFARNPGKYKLIAGALAAGMPGAWIARELHTNHHMIAVVAQREKRYIANLSEYIGNLNKYAGKIIAERILEELPDLHIRGVEDLQALARIGDLLTKQEMLRLGEATERVEHVTGPKVMDLREALDALPVDAEEVPETSTSAETRGSGTGGAEMDEDGQDGGQNV